MTSVSSMLSLCSGLDDVGDVAALATQSLAVVDTYVLSALHGSISKERVTDVKATYAASTSIVDDARLSDDELDAFRRIVEDEA